MLKEIHGLGVTVDDFDRNRGVCYVKRDNGSVVTLLFDREPNMGQGYGGTRVWLARNSACYATRDDLAAARAALMTPVGTGRLMCSEQRDQPRNSGVTRASIQPTWSLA